MLDGWDRTRLEFGEALTHLRAMRRDDEDVPGACDRVVRLAETAAAILRGVREEGRTTRRNSRASPLGPAD